MKLKTKAFLLSLAVIAPALAGGGYASLANDSNINNCNYNSDGKYVDPTTGVVSATATMDHAARCASTGDLPEAVIKRLGIFGQKERAEAIIAIDAEAKRHRQERDNES